MTYTNTHCLNCANELSGKYCSECGQKADTHRITFRNFVSHDLLHGTFHIEKGILFTAKEALTDNSSWQKYNQFWWADLMQKNVQYKLENNGDGWLDSLEENPLEVVTVNVLMHNSWFPDIQEVVENEEVFNSTAFFVS